MKKIDELKSLSTEELMEKRKKLKKTYTVLGALMAIAFIYMIFTAIQTKNYAFIGIIGGASLTLLPGINQLKAIDDELKERNQSQPIK